MKTKSEAKEYQRNKGDGIWSKQKKMLDVQCQGTKKEDVYQS